MNLKKTLIAIAIALTAFAGVADAQVTNFWKLAGSSLSPVVNSWGMLLRGFLYLGDAGTASLHFDSGTGQLNIGNNFPTGGINLTTDQNTGSMTLNSGIVTVTAQNNGVHLVGESYAEQSGLPTNILSAPTTGDMSIGTSSSRNSYLNFGNIESIGDNGVGFSWNIASTSVGVKNLYGDWAPVTASYNDNQMVGALPNTFTRIKNGQMLRMAAVGDSIVMPPFKYIYDHYNKLITGQTTVANGIIGGFGGFGLVNVSFDGNGATAHSADSDYWSNHYSITNGQTLREYSVDNTNVNANTFTVYIAAHSGDGTLKVETNLNGAGWVTASSSVACSAASTQLNKYSTTSPAVGAYQLRVTGVTGTCTVIGFKLYDNTSLGIPLSSLDLGGSSVADIAAVPAAISGPLFQDMNLDLILFAWRDSPTLFSANIPTIEAVFSQYATSTDIVYVGQYPLLTGDVFSTINQNSTMKYLARRYGRPYFDGYNLYASAQQGSTTIMLTGDVNNVHPTCSQTFVSSGSASKLGEGCNFIGWNLLNFLNLDNLIQSGYQNFHSDTITTTNLTATNFNPSTLALPTTASLSVGTVKINGSAVLSAYGTNDLFLGGAGNFTTTGNGNLGIGSCTMNNLTNGTNNAGVGVCALGNLAGGSFDAGVGSNALYGLTSGADSVGIGYNSGRSFTTTSDNTCVGNWSCYSDNNGIDTPAGLSYAGAIGSYAQVLCSNCLTLGGQQSFNRVNVGIGTSTPFATLSVVSGGTKPLVDFATSSGKSVSGIDADGHPYTSGPAPVISSCGTGTGTVVGDDQSGTITTATAATACTATFAKAWAATPICNVTDNSLVGFADISSLSTSAVTFGISSALTGGLLYYQCSYHK